MPSTLLRVGKPRCIALLKAHDLITSPPARSLGHNANAVNALMRHTRTVLSYFVFPDCEFSSLCAADVVFYRCMKVNPLAPPAGGAFFMRAVCCVQPVLRPPR